MSDRSVEHTTIVVERAYDAPLDRVFAAWADPQAKARWFHGSDGEFELDFREGGWERGRGSLPGGREYAFEALYREIVPDARIVYTYDMFVDRVRISVSLVTAEFRAEGGGTRLVFTEQGAFLDGHETSASRDQGWGSLLDSLGRWLGPSRESGGNSS